MTSKFVTYYRVSTSRQGVHGLGMDAQKAAVEAYLNGGDWTVVGEFREVESGKRSDRPELAKAIALAKAEGAKLLIAKLDRLSRDVHFLTGLEKQGVEFVAADMASANRFTVHVMAAVAQQEREMISARTIAALASIKDKIARDGHHVSKAGNTIRKLGVYERSRPFTEGMRAASMASRKAKAGLLADRVGPTIQMMRDTGASLQAVADHLNGLGVTTSRGSSWTPIAVSRVQGRIAPTN